jgi:hypothetical protein
VRLPLNITCSSDLLANTPVIFIPNKDKIVLHGRYKNVYELKDETKTFSFKIGNPIGGVMVSLFASSADHVNPKTIQLVVISWRSVLLVEETGRPGENNRFVAIH